MDRDQKRVFVESFRQILQAQELVVVTQQSGLTVREADQLRLKVRAYGAGFRVVKNSLSRLCIDQTPREALKPFLKGATAWAFSLDPVAAARAVVEFAESNKKLEIVCGMSRDTLLSVQEVEFLARLPSMDELRSKLLSVLAGPATRLASVLRAPSERLVRVLSAYEGGQ